MDCLTPNSDKAVIAAYKTAIDEMWKDPNFVRAGKAMSEDFIIQTPDQVTASIKTLAETPDEAIAFIKAIAAKQGLSMK